MKNMTKRADRKSKVSIIFLILFCIFAFLGASLWIALKHGIVLDRINLSSVKVERISVKVDRGIIVSVDLLDVLTKQTTDSTSNPELLIVQFNKWAYLFREIRINQIRIQEHTYQLLFKDNQFNVSGNNFQLTSTIAYEKGAVHMDISTLEVKPYSVTFTGKAIYVLKPEKITFSGRFSGQEASGKIAFSKHRDQVSVEINTDNFTDLPGILARFPLDKELITWITENITAQDYNIEPLRLNFTLQDGKPNIRPDSISGKAVAKNASIRFHPSLAPVECEQINISFNNDQLSFDLQKPMYKTKSLAGSNVLIHNLIADGSQMDINIQTDTQLDSEILEILDTYDIHLPFSQHRGTTKAGLQLVFDLPDFTLSTNGVFTTGKGDWTWRDISFQTSGATVQLKNNLITLDNAQLTYRDIIKASLNGTVDFASQQAMMITDIEQLRFQDGDKDIVRVQNLSTPINIQFGGDEAKINLSNLRTNIILSPSQRLITLGNLNEVKPFVPFLQDLPFQNGVVNIDFIDPENLTFDGFIDTTALPLSSNDKPITHFAFQGSKSTDKLTASINEGKISLAVSDRISVNLHDYLFVVNTNNQNLEKTSILSIPLQISGLKSLVKFKDTLLLTNNFQAELNNSNVTYTAKLDQGEILFQSTSEGMTLTASDIDAQIMQSLIQHGDLEGGKFNASIKGTPENFEGYIEFSNVLLKNYAVLNNVLTFANAIPALATLSSPGFDTNGYRVKEGVLHFNLSNKFLTIHQFRTDGATINTETQGWVDFGNDTVELKMELISLKDYSKIISMIPLAGYAILGEDGSLSTSLDITGSRTKPEITTHLSEDVVMIPINIVKRTIKWPFKLFNDAIDFVNEKPEPEE